MEKAQIKDLFKIIIKESQGEKLPESFERELEVPLSEDKIITVYGPRRSGKSFYFYGIIKKLLKDGIPEQRILNLSFEDDRMAPLEMSDLDLLLEAYFELYPENKEHVVYFFFDEIQTVENWEVFIRRVNDKEKARIFVTGSSSRLLSREIATALRGRTFSYALYPLSFREFLRFRGELIEKDFEYTENRFRVKKLLEEFLEWGGFPEVVVQNNVLYKRKILSEYFNLLVYRDLADRFSIDNKILLKGLLRYLFTNCTSLLSVNSYFHSVRKEMHVSRETISEYLSYIQESEYISLLPKFSYSLKSQQVSPRKIITIDNGLRNSVSFRFSSDEGRLAENLVGSMLIRLENERFYWKNKREVDFVIKSENTLNAINVSLGERIEERERASLLEFKDHYNDVKELLLITKDTERKEQDITLIPLWKWLLTVGK
jgi:uncharacterized protein